MSKTLNVAQAIRLRRLKPLYQPANDEHCICNQCRYINPASYSFCSNCGWPVHETPSLKAMYRARIKHRKELLYRYQQIIATARVFLYIIGGFCLSGIGYLFSQNDERYILFALTIVMAVLFVLLGRWSIAKPFTALLVSFVVIITFSTISILGRLFETVSSTSGLYTIIVTMVIVYFILRGIQAAYRADLITEEFEIL